MDEPSSLFNFLGLDMGLFKTVLDNAKDIQQDDKFFASLSAIAAAKRAVKDALEAVEAYEKDAKGLINAKAKAVIGPDWQVIKGPHFKIQKSPTGKIYELDEEVDKIDPEMVVVSFSPNKDNIDTYREANNNKLPAGVSLNEHRGESISITVK